MHNIKVFFVKISISYGHMNESVLHQTLTVKHVYLYKEDAENETMVITNFKLNPWQRQHYRNCTVYNELHYKRVVLYSKISPICRSFKRCSISIHVVL